MRFEKRNQIDIDPTHIQDLAQTLDIRRTSAEILCSRGMTDADAALDYMGLKPFRYSNPFSISSMDLAALRVNRALENEEKIVIYSDYDADGVCGCAIVLRKLQAMGASNYAYYTPEREKEGYGMNTQAVREIAKMGCDLIITVDCGISNVQEIQLAQELGMDVIVTDHHSCPEVLPDCIIVNPKLGCMKGQENLCGAAVAMKLCQAFGGGVSFNEGMELCAIATVADMMPLVGENRHLVNQGLAIINESPSHEIAVLKKAMNKDRVDAMDIAFGIGPVINAAGRIATAHLCIDLLAGLTDDPQNAAERMVEYNNQRKRIERKVYDDAITMLEQEDLSQRISIVLYNPQWPLGVVGIAASKLMNTFGRPVILLSEGDGKIKGSCRGVDGINMFDILCELEPLLEQFGGHSKAAGLTLKAGMYDDFKSQFDEKLHVYDSTLFDRVLYYDIEVNPSDVDLNLVQEIGRMQPFGQSNPSVKFLMRGVRASSYRTMGKDNNHYMATLDDGKGGLKCTAFFSHLPDGAVDGDMVCDVIVSPVENVWNQVASPRGMVDGIHVYFSSETDYQQYISKIDNQLQLAQCEAMLLPATQQSMASLNVTINDLCEVLDNQDYGNLILVADVQAANALPDILGIERMQRLHIERGMLPKGIYGRNTVLIAPQYDQLENHWYQRIYYLGSYSDQNIMNYLAHTLQQPVEKIIIKDNPYNLDKMAGLDMSIERMREIYAILRDHAKKHAIDRVIQQPLTHGITAHEMRIALDVFCEAGLVEQLKEQPYYIVKGTLEKKIEETKGYMIFHDTVQWMKDHNVMDKG